ncbi:hypothetical protein, partial [Burkholderia cenocepacia]|uniref:hypothetical protein n=1 Tax=Burkholderia cenocepacia TaxID=95486 RepID=UPI003BB95AA0
EDRGEGSGGNTLAKGRNYAAGDENIFGHRWMLAGKTDYTVKPALLSAIDVMIAPFRADPRRPCAAARTGRPVGAARMRRQAFRPADEASG